MKRIATAMLLAVAVGMFPAAAQADTVTLQDWTAGNFAANGGSGGPFSATTTGSLLGDRTFMTFCIEHNESFQYGVPYSFTLSNGAIGGGLAGGNPDEVSDITKWLYYQAVSGQYASWYPLATGSPLGANVGADFQHAIWYLEDERSLEEVGGIGGNPNKIVIWAAANQNWADLAAAGHQVYAMNLESASGAPVQDQLAYVAPVPDPGSTLILLCMGTIGLQAFRKRSQ